MEATKIRWDGRNSANIDSGRKRFKVRRKSDVSAKSETRGELHVSQTKNDEDESNKKRKMSWDECIDPELKIFVDEEAVSSSFSSSCQTYNNNNVKEDKDECAIRPISSDKEKQRAVVNMIAKYIDCLQDITNESLSNNDIIGMIYDSSIDDKSVFLSLKAHLFGSTDVVGAILPRRKTTEKPLRMLHLESKEGYFSENQSKKIVKLTADTKKQLKMSQPPQWAVYGNVFEESTRHVINRVYRNKFVAFSSGTLIWDLGNCLSSTPDYLLIETEGNPLNEKLRQLPGFKNKKIPVILQPRKDNDYDTTMTEKKDLLDYTLALKDLNVDEVVDKAIGSSSSSDIPDKIIIFKDGSKAELVKPSTDKMTYSKLERARIIGVGECKTNVMSEEQLTSYRKLLKLGNEVDLVDIFESTKTAWILDSFIHKDTKRRSKSLPRVGSELTKELNECFRNSSWTLYDWESKKTISLRSNERCRLKLFRKGIGPQVLNEMEAVLDRVTIRDTISLIIVLTSIIDNSVGENGERSRKDKLHLDADDDKSNRYQGIYSLVNKVEVPKDALFRLRKVILDAHYEDYNSYYQ